MLERFRRYEESDENEMSSVKLDETRGRFLGMCLVPKHSDQIPVPGYSDKVVEVRVLRDEDVGSVALRN